MSQAGQNGRSGGGGALTLIGDIGSATGSTITLFANTAAVNCGSSVNFTNSASTSTLNVTDANNNTIIGLDAGNASLTGNSCTGLGKGVFQNLGAGTNLTAMGFKALNGIGGNSNSTAVGANALQAMFGQRNTAVGQSALGSASGSSGSFNTSIGDSTLLHLVNGSANLAIGTATSAGAGSQYTGAESNNILINNVGVTGESNVMRIGAQGVSQGQVNTCFIAGITGSTVTGAAVLCSTAGQLGTISSSKRYKKDIEDYEGSILDLRPVEFRYKANDAVIHFGFIAEEVKELFPELCLYDDHGTLETLAYHEMPALLLKEIQRLNERLALLEKKAT